MKVHEFVTTKFYSLKILITDLQAQLTYALNALH